MRSALQVMTLSVVLCAQFAALPAASAESFRFAWPVPGSTTVTAVAHKAGTTSTVRYSALLSPTADGGRVLQFRDYRLVSIDGEAPGDDAAFAAVEQRARLAMALSGMRLTPAGEYVGLLEKSQLRSTLGDDPDLRTSVARLDELLQNYDSPQVQAVLGRQASDVWRIWVSTWNGVELTAGETLQGRGPIELYGSELEQNILIEHLGQAEDRCAACVGLRMTTIVEGPEILALLGTILQQLDGNAAAASEYVSARRMTVTEVFTRPDTLQPRYASENIEFMVRNAAGETHSQRERKEYWFAWN